jgi:hypothetical protein
VTAERNVVHDIREALGLETDVILWRNTTGQVVDHRGVSPRTIRYGLAIGSSDLVGIGPGGRFFALEVKGEGGRLSVEQIQWIDLVRARGGFAAMVRTVDEAKAALERARRGEVQ